LLALAIIDDIGAIVVIALFFSSGFELSGLAIAALGVGAIMLLQRLGVRRALAYVPAALVIWVGFLKAGIHPTVAGVVAGLLTPVRSWFGRKGLFSAVRRTVIELKRSPAAEEDDLIGPLAELENAQREAIPPVVRLQASLHPWVAFGIMPLFALANAGVRFDGLDLSVAGAPLLAGGITLGLVLGKPLGILLASVLSVRLGISALPTGVSWRGIALVGTVAGIGFTMAIFVAGLAFPGNPSALGMAKLSVLVASAVAAVATLIVGRFFLPVPTGRAASLTLSEAEASTEY
jgi:NhaA family Na+:H+ antiporter